MSFPNPEPGMVISYSYLWRYENERGTEEGRKDCPCVIILSVENENNYYKVTVAPITHRQPDNHENAIEIPLKVKNYIGLDMERSWVITTEVNEFMWPGYDLRPIKGKGINYGFLPPKLFELIKGSILNLFLRRRSNVVNRD